MRKCILTIVFILITLGISSMSRAWHQDVYKSVYIARLTPEQFLSVDMPKDRCSPWVMWETGNSEIPRVTIIHVAEHNRRPRLHVISQYLKEKAFQKVLEKIKGFWHATGIGPITRTIEGDLVAIITFPGQTIDMDGLSTTTISDTILINVKEHEVFLGQVDEFAKDIYRESTIDLWCDNLPVAIVNNFPYPDQMVAR